MFVQGGFETYNSSTLVTSLKGIEGEVMKKIEKVKLYHDGSHHTKYLVIDFSQNNFQIKKSRGDIAAKYVMLSDIRACTLIDDNDQM